MRNLCIYKLHVYIYSLSLFYDIDTNTKCV